MAGDETTGPGGAGQRPEATDDGAAGASAARAAASEPPMQVVSGSPTPEEQAAIEAALVAMADEWAETKHRRVLDTESEWQAKSRTPSGRRWHRG